MSRVWQEENSRKDHGKLKRKKKKDKWNDPIKFSSTSVKKVKMILQYLGDKQENIGTNIKMKYKEDFLKFVFLCYHVDQPVY